ncbi:hypothetical protein ES703_14102 [subsurface metagenome]
MGESQAPARSTVDHDEENDSALIHRGRAAMGERAGLIVGECSALPVADSDCPIGTARLNRTDGRKQRGDDHNPTLHNQPPRTGASVWTFATVV